MKPQKSRTRAAETRDLIFKSQGSGDHVVTHRRKGERKGGRRYSSIFRTYTVLLTVLCNSSTIAALQDHCSNFISYTKGDIPAKLKAITADCIVAAVRQQSHNARGYLQDPVQPDSPARMLTCTRETEDNPQTE